MKSRTLDNKLNQELKNESSHTRGFGAAVGLILLSLGSVALVLATLIAAISFADKVFRHEMRVQKGLSERACADSAMIMKAKDAFASGYHYFREFDCGATL